MFQRADAARVTAAHAQINGFMTALGAYKLDTSTFPTTEQGLQALRVKPAGVPLVEWPVSAAGSSDRSVGPALLYKFPGEHGDEPDIVSLGADGVPAAKISTPTF